MFFCGVFGATFIGDWTSIFSGMGMEKLFMTSSLTFQYVDCKQFGTSFKKRERDLPFFAVLSFV